MPNSSGVTVFDDLPEWLVVDEILVRLPAKDVLCCRAVRKSWRSGTSTNAFILNHHHRQSSLPIIQNIEGICRHAGSPSDQNIQPVLQHTDPFTDGLTVYHAACDGLLILENQSNFYICNPATRKCASLPHPPRRPGISAVDVVGFYRLHTSGEHRVLWVSYSKLLKYSVLLGAHAAVELPDYFVLTVGSDQPRCIQWPTVSKHGFPATLSFRSPPIHNRGSLHWATGLNITVFDTVAETFRQMSRPAQLGDEVSLLDMGDTLALCCTTPDSVNLDVWVLQDYDAETWGFQYRINLSAVEASPPLNLSIKHVPGMALINERELLIEQCVGRLLHCDIDGVFLGNVGNEEPESRFMLTMHRLQESMISLPLFEAQEEDAVHMEPPFVIVL